MTPKEIVAMIGNISNRSDLRAVQKSQIAFIENLILQEREACAKIADKHSKFQREQHSMNEAIVLRNVAQAIRARK